MNMMSGNGPLTHYTKYTKDEGEAPLSWEPVRHCSILLRRTIRGPLRRSRPEKILNVFQRIHFRFFRPCGLAPNPGSFASSRTAMPDRLLEKSPAGRTPTGTGQFAVVMRLFIVEGQFGAGLDGVSGIEFRAFADNPHKGVRRAGMVNEPEAILLGGAVDRLVVVHFDDGDFFLVPGPPPAFPPADELPLIFSQFLPGPEVDHSEEAPSLDTAAFDHHGNRPTGRGGGLWFGAKDASGSGQGS